MKIKIKYKNAGFWLRVYTWRDPTLWDCVGFRAANHPEERQPITENVAIRIPREKPDEQPPRIVRSYSSLWLADRDENFRKQVVAVHWRRETSAADQWGKSLSLNAGIRLRSSCVSPVNAVPRGSQMESLWRKRRGLELYSTSQHSVTRWSDGKSVRKGAGLRALFHQSTQCHTVVRWKVCEERGGA